MKVLKKTYFLVKCPICQSVLKATSADIRKSPFGAGFVECPVCHRHIVIYTIQGLNESINIKIMEDNDRSE